MIYRIAMQAGEMTATFSNSLAMRANSRLAYFTSCILAALLTFAFCADDQVCLANVAASESSGTVRMAPGAQYEWTDPVLGNNKAAVPVVGTVENKGLQADSKTQSLPMIARFTLRRFFKLEPAARGLEDYASKVKCDSVFRKSAGVFVTLSKNGATRACWGSVYAQQADIVHETIFSTLGALTKEYRFRPIRKSELPDLKIQVSIIRDIIAINNFASVNPLKDGIMVRSGGRSGVILPGEATDAYYEFVLARLKAGIKPGEPCQIYKLRTDIYD